MHKYKITKIRDSIKNLLWNQVKDHSTIKISPFVWTEPNRFCHIIQHEVRTKIVNEINL